MVAIRLRRAGSKKRPFFRVVVTDSRAARDSSFVEILGHYNPRTKPAIVQVDKERVEHWIKQGAQPSDSVRTLIARHLSPPPAPRVRMASAASAQAITGGSAAPAKPAAAAAASPELAPVEAPAPAAEDTAAAPAEAPATE
jgi:small subunit ribosomal protein S16